MTVTLRYLYSEQSLLAGPVASLLSLVLFLLFCHLPVEEMRIHFKSYKAMMVKNENGSFINVIPYSIIKTKHNLPITVLPSKQSALLQWGKKLNLPSKQV